MRSIRQDSQARATWLRLGRLVSVVPEVALAGEMESSGAPSAFECFFDVGV